MGRAVLSRTALESKYGIKIVDDGYYNPLKHRYVKAYKIYSADGCCWEKGLSNLKEVQAECEEWSKQLLDIKEHMMCNFG